MKFWDASAVVPLLLREPETDRMVAGFEADRDAAIWWATPVECASAMARHRRGGAITVDHEARFLERLELFRESCHEILAGDELRRTAMRLLRVHPLRAADALQLAAAITWAGSPPFEGAELVTLDDRLAEAATLEGFDVQP